MTPWSLPLESIHWLLQEENLIMARTVLPWFSGLGQERLLEWLLWIRPCAGPRSQWEARSSDVAVSLPDWRPCSIYCRPTSQVFSPWSWCFRGKVAQDMWLSWNPTVRTLLSGEGTRARAVSELTPLCTFLVPDSVMWSRWLRICLLDSEACRQRTTVFMNSTKCS